MQHAQIDETTPIQVLESSEQLTQSRHGVQLQDDDFSQDIEHILKHMDMKMEKLESEQDIDLMPYNQEFDPLASPDLKEKRVLSDQQDTAILEDNMEWEMHNISFDES